MILFRIMRKKYAEKAYYKGRIEGLSIAVQILLDFVAKGIITLNSAIDDSGLKQDEFYSIAKSLGYSL